MATYTLVKLKDMTPLHIGTGKENYDFSALDLQSDTLSAALAAMKAQNGESGDLEEFLNSFTISSAFPFVGDRYFLPKPQGKISVTVSDGEEYVSRKKLKKIKYIEVDLWSDLVAGKEVSVVERQLQDKFLLSIRNGDFRKPYKSQVNQRVTISREEGIDADPFFFEWVYFHSDSGLYCLLDTQESQRDDLIRLFKQLGEFGVGTDKNIGGGKFDVEIRNLSLPEIATPDSQLLLSLFIPAKEEVERLNLQDSWYDLLQRGGYIAGSQEMDFRHLRKKSVYMFKVGSVFKTTDRLSGKVVNLRPRWDDEQLHSVFRSGKPFVVPVKLKP
ncbi:type III-A CRISPR-associated RAMP protein Csm4 [Parabacteroides sp.]